ncbi:MAG: flagellar hook-length control protein FliK [Armatimonadota bacterium]
MEHGVIDPIRDVDSQRLHQETDFVPLEVSNTSTERVPSEPEPIGTRSLPFPALHLMPLAGGEQQVVHSSSQEPRLYEQVAQAMERLILHREEQAVHLQIDPPELGALEIRLQVSGSEVYAWLTAERDQTRQALEQQTHLLREQLASRGLHLAHFEVHTGSGGAFERARHAFVASPSLPHLEPAKRPSLATDSLHLFGQWSAWA